MQIRLRKEETPLLSAEMTRTNFNIHRLGSRIPASAGLHPQGHDAISMDGQSPVTQGASQLILSSGLEWLITDTLLFLLALTYTRVDRVYLAFRLDLLDRRFDSRVAVIPVARQ